MRLILVPFFFFFLSSISKIDVTFSQSIPTVDNSILEELKFSVQNKLLNQFIRRFNGEEYANGKRIYPSDEKYKSKKIRKKSFDLLFDYAITDSEKIASFKKLKQLALSNTNPLYLDLHNGNFFVELKVFVYYKNKVSEMTLFLKLQEEKIGSKWVIFKVDFPTFDREFNFNHNQDKFFLHPLSHEIGFINLEKILNKKEYVELLVDNSFNKIDHLTLFLDRVQTGQIKLYSIGEMQYHFFQIDNFYFNIKYINRDAQNAGWLINDIVNATFNDLKTLEKFILE